MLFGPIILHVNYLEPEEDVSTICQKAADIGFDGVEFRRRPARAYGQERYLDEICRGVQRSGLRFVSFGGPGPNLMQADEGERQADIKEVLSFYEAACNRLPLEVLNVFSGPLSAPDVPNHMYHKHGSAYATDDQWAYAISGYQDIARFAESKGIRMAFETHMHYLHDTVASTCRLVDAIGLPSVGINLDIGNTLLFENPVPAEEQLRDCGEKLFYLHCKNFQKTYGGEKFPCELANGVINYRSILKQAYQQGFRGPICLEAPRPGDREWFAQEDISYMQALLTDLEDEIANRNTEGQIV